MAEPIKIPDCTAGELKAAIDMLTNGYGSTPVFVQSLDGVMLECVVVQNIEGCILIEGVFER